MSFARLLFGLLLVGPSASGDHAAAETRPPADWLRIAAERLCPLSGLTGAQALTAIPGSRLVEEQVPTEGAAPSRSLLRLETPGGRLLEIEQRLRGGQMVRFRATVHGQENDAVQPRFEGIADASCTLRLVRGLRDGDGPWRYLDHFDADLVTLRATETLQAPWPAGRDSGGVRVGFVDSGLAYDLPLFHDRLARDADGTPLGHDFWDMDPWPYDGDMARGAFHPIRHGTAVASIFAAEAPDAALVPYRYPRPDMARLGDLVAQASAHGVRILALPLGSTRRSDWDSFEAALAAHDILAIVSAGNDGRDIDARPVYPAALPAENLITVTSSDGSGQLARGSNWGATYVDLMLPAENQKVTQFNGARGTGSGSSYAVPRLAALAARLLATDPSMTTGALKARIFARAVPALPDALAVGWIPDPLAD
jgi:subtilisin family serine protease